MENNTEVKIFMPKKIVSLLLTAVLAVQCCLLASAAAQPDRNVNKLRDVSENDWYYVYVKRLYEDGIINGVTDTSYSPDSEVKTSEIAALITRYSGNERTAENCAAYLTRKNIEGANLWYAGYIQLMCDMGIFDSADIERYGIVLTESGGAAISKSSAALIDSPVRRMDVVKFIAKSFEIKKGRTETNRLKSEISGNGNEFINGGGYDDETLEKIKGMIADYEDIRYEYRTFFLKCYYNGIIRGDENGNVLPRNNLRRSELAKIIATVIYYDMRENDIRDLPEACVITSGDYYISPTDGGKVLKKEKAEKILRERAKNIKTDNSGNYIKINIYQNNIIPAGYLSEIYIYRYDGGATHEEGKLNCSTNVNEYFPKNDSFSISKENKPANDIIGYAYLILRDLNRNGEIAGAVMYNIDFNGNLKDASVYYLP